MQSSTINSEGKAHTWKIFGRVTIFPICGAPCDLDKISLITDESKVMKNVETTRYKGQIGNRSCCVKPWETLNWRRRFRFSTLSIGDTLMGFVHHKGQGKQQKLWQNQF